MSNALSGQPCRAIPFFFARRSCRSEHPTRPCTTLLKAYTPVKQSTAALQVLRLECMVAVNGSASMEILYDAASAAAPSRRRSMSAAGRATLAHVHTSAGRRLLLDTTISVPVSHVLEVAALPQEGGTTQVRAKCWFHAASV